MDVVTATDYCRRLGAQVPYDLTTGDFPFLAGVKKEMAGWGIWLNITIQGGRYRWGISGAEVAKNLWRRGQPDCSSGCGVEFWAGDGGAGLETTSDERHPFCMFHLTNDDQLEKLQTRWSSIDSEERASMERIVNRSLIKNQVDRMGNRIMSNLRSEMADIRSWINEMKIALEERVNENHRTLASEMQALTKAGIVIHEKVTTLSNRVDETVREDRDGINETSSHVQAVDARLGVLESKFRALVTSMTAMIGKMI